MTPMKLSDGLLYLAMVLAVAVTGCRASDGSATTVPEAGSSASESTDDAGGGTATVYDDCVLPSPSGKVPDDLRAAGDIVTTDEFGEFSKSLSVYGITLVAKDDVPDDFVRAIGATVVEMFPLDVQDPAGQAEILRNLHAYRAVIPVFAGGEAGIDEGAIDSILGRVSVCDIIMLDVPERQAMEVVEHLMHIISDVGLHHAYPGRWGMTDASELFDSSEEAEVAGVYQTSSYRDIDELPVRRRVILQEYAYWISTTYWDLQVAYGPDEPEWSARTPAALAALVPSAQQLIEGTIAMTMAGPSTATMDALDRF